MKQTLLMGDQLKCEHRIHRATQHCEKCGASAHWIKFYNHENMDFYEGAMGVIDTDYYPTAFTITKTTGPIDRSGFGDPIQIDLSSRGEIKYTCWHCGTELESWKYSVRGQRPHLTKPACKDCFDRAGPGDEK